MRRRAFAAVIVALLAPTSMAFAHNVGLRHTAEHRFNECRRALGPTPCGRNIVKQGWKERGKSARPATLEEVAKWSRRLHALAHPPHFLSVNSTNPRLPSGGGAQTARLAPQGLAACIVNSESGGNPQAQNGVHHGIAQWDSNAWAKMGGTKYAADPLGATYQQQLQVLSYGLQHFGCADWCPYDPC